MWRRNRGKYVKCKKEEEEEEEERRRICDINNIGEDQMKVKLKRIERVRGTC